MYTGFKHLHSTLAYVLLGALIFSIIYVLIAYAQKKPFTDKTRKFALIGLVSAHIQFLVGLLLYVFSPLGLKNFSGEAMKDSLARLYILEHPFTMLIAVVLITIGYSRAKRLKTDAARYKSILIYFGLGLILILSRIPWVAWPKF